MALESKAPLKNKRRRVILDTQRAWGSTGWDQIAVPEKIEDVGWVDASSHEGLTGRKGQENYLEVSVDGGIERWFETGNIEP